MYSKEIFPQEKRKKALQEIARVCNEYPEVSKAFNIVIKFSEALNHSESDLEYFFKTTERKKRLKKFIPAMFGFTEQRENVYVKDNCYLFKFGNVWVITMGDALSASSIYHGKIPSYDYAKSIFKQINI